MNLTQLEYFIMVAEEENLTKVSKRLFISQPGLSKTIARIEAEVATKLFIRNGKKIELNEAGKKFYSWAKPTIEDYHKLIDEISSNTKHRSRKLNLAISGIQFSRILLREFQKHHPEIEISETMFLSDDFPDIIFDKKVDAVLSAKNYEHHDVESICIFREPLYFICPVDSKYALKSSVSLEEAASETLLFLNQKNVFQEYIEDLFATHNLTPHISGRFQREHLADMLSIGLGYSIYAKSSLESLGPQNQYTVLPFKEESCMRYIYLLIRKGKSSNTAVQLLINFIHSQFDLPE